VLDSNVYVSAFTNTHSLAFRLWILAYLRRYRLLVSPAVIDELGGVLRLKFGWPDDAVTRNLKLLTKVAEMVSPRTTLRVIEEDDDDNRILECALEGRADLIVTSDSDLLRLESFRSIGIVRPVDFHLTLGG
jgi:putative PIN family toxin of toxin-antitoxin system